MAGFAFNFNMGTFERKLRVAVMYKIIRGPFIGSGMTSLALRYAILQKLTAVNILMAHSTFGRRCTVINRLTGNRFCMALTAGGLHMPVSKEECPSVLVRIFLHLEGGKIGLVTNRTVVLFELGIKLIAMRIFMTRLTRRRGGGKLPHISLLIH